MTSRQLHDINQEDMMFFNYIFCTGDFDFSSQYNVVRKIIFVWNLPPEEHEFLEMFERRASVSILTADLTSEEITMATEFLEIHTARREFETVLGCLSVDKQEIRILCLEYYNGLRYKNRLLVHIGRRKVNLRRCLANGNTYKKTTFFTLERRRVHVASGDTSCFREKHELICNLAEHPETVRDQIYNSVKSHLLDADAAGKLSTVFSLPGKKNRQKKCSL